MEKKDYRELLEKEYIDFSKFSKEELYALFDELNKEMETVYKFVAAYIDYMNTKHNYSSETELTMLEAHVLTDICDKSDPTVTTLAREWHRSLSATSQTVRKLVEKGLVYRENSAVDGKVFYLRPTEKGIRVSDGHKSYDCLDTVKTLKSLHHVLSYDEIMTMFKGLKAYIKLLYK